MATFGQVFGAPQVGGQSPLASANLFVGNASGIATAVALSGDGTLANTGALTITKINGVVFPFTSAGVVTAADNSGASLSFTGVNIQYSQSGNIVYVSGTLTYPATVSASAASVTLTNAPLAANAQYGYGIASLTTQTNLGGALIAPNTRVISFYTTSATSVATTNVQLSGSQIRFSCTYPAT